MATRFSVESTIAAPPELVWACLTDDDLIGQSISGVYSRPAPGGALISELGRLTRSQLCELQVVVPGVEMIERQVSSVVDFQATFRLEPVAGGTRVSVEGKYSRRGMYRLVLAPFGSGAKKGSGWSLDCLRLRAESLAAGHRDMYRPVVAATNERPERLHSRIARMLRRSDPAAADGWSAAAPEMRNAVLVSALSGSPCPDRYGAQLATAVAARWKTSATRQLVWNGMLAIFFVWAIAMEAAGGEPDVEWIVVFALLLWWTLSIAFVCGGVARRVCDASMHANAEWLAHVDPIEHLIGMSRSQDPAQRNYAIQQLGVAPVLGPLNLRAEAALARAASEPDAQWTGAAHALAARQARALAAAA